MMSLRLACHRPLNGMQNNVIYLLVIRDDGSQKGSSTGAASSATEELDVLMASLSTFKVGNSKK